MAEEQEQPDPSLAAGRHGTGAGKRILGGTATGAAIGATVGMLLGLSKERTVPKTMASMAANYALAGTLISGIGEVSRAALQTDTGSMVNTVVGGFATGAIFSRLGGSRRPFALGLLFSCVGITVHLAVQGWEEYRLRKFIDNLPDEAFPEELLEQRRRIEEARRTPLITFPHWFPIQIERKEKEARKLSEQQKP